MDFVSSFLQKLIGFWENVWSTIYEYLPKSPIRYLESNPTVNNVLQCVNFFIPVYTIVSIFQLWLLAIAMFYVYSVLLRWVKVVE